MKKIISFVLVIGTIISCDFGTDHGFNEQEEISKIYQFNISDSSTNFLVDGFNPKLLHKSKKLLYYVQVDYGNTNLWIYDLYTKEHKLVTNDVWRRILLSPDEKSLLYFQGKKLMRLNISSGQEQTLFISDQTILDYPYPIYSKDGKKILYLSYPKTTDNEDHTDSHYVNIYDLEVNKSIRVDSVFIRGNDAFRIGFTNDSKIIYVLRKGFNEYHQYQSQFTFYRNDTYPKYYHTESIIHNGFNNDIFTIDDDKLLILEDYLILQYDISDDEFTKRNHYKLYRDIVAPINGMDKLIGREWYDNSIGIVSYFGKLENIYNPKVDDQIFTIDYLVEDRIIIFGTTKWIDK